MPLRRSNRELWYATLAVCAITLGYLFVLAWQEAVLNLNAVCDQCNAVLHKGSRAGIGVRELPGPRPVICPQCLAELSRPDAAVARTRR